MEYGNYRDSQQRELYDFMRDQMSFTWSACSDDGPVLTQSGKRPKTSHYNEHVQLSPVSAIQASSAITVMTKAVSSCSTISSWDIDGGLAADFDGSLSGLGAELGSTTYNMSEALLALPVFKQENLDNGFQYMLDEATFPAPWFQYILGAATSPAVKVNEETLTYLNQGQSYEIKLKKLGEITDYDGQYLRSTVKVCFHERRLQYMEKEQMYSWMNMRPGERILDIDIPLSYGLIDVKQDALNAIDFVWDPTKETGIYVKVNCISTEFTAKKHGGEKGVPFRLQVDTRASKEETSKLIHCASCQIRVFKPKGADRKHKTDRDKMEKRSGSEKDKYQPSYECTVLTDIPVESVTQSQTPRNGLGSLGSFTSLSQALKEQSITPEAKAGQYDVWQWQQPHPAVSGGSPPTPMYQTSQATTASNRAYLTSTTNSTSRITDEPASPMSMEGSPTQSIGTNNDQAPSPTISMPISLSQEASAKEVTAWLNRNRFSSYSNTFQNFSGADLMRLTRDDLIQICGLAAGIRLNNALQSRTVRPRLTLYMCQEPGTVYHAVYLEQLSKEELLGKISDLFNFDRCSVTECYVQGPSAIHILLTDEVVRNFQEQSRFWLEILDQDSAGEKVKLLLKTIE